jgi:hypothetical protein
MIWLCLSRDDIENFILKLIMTNTDKVNQLATLLSSNSRLPSKPIIHQLAYNENTIQLLSSIREVQKHITFIVIQPEQTYLLTNKLFQSVHCVIVLNIGVILSSSCSTSSEEILEHIAKWVPYLKPENDVQFYARY